MGYLTMCALSARARRCGSCVLPSPCPRGDLSTWCVERAIAAAPLQGVPGARPGDCVVGLLCMVMQPPEPVATDQAGRRRAHAASWLPRLRHRRGQAPGPHACGASTGRLIADALCPPDPRRSGTVSHDRTAMRCPGGRPGLARLPVVPSGNARPPRVADRGRGHAEASRAVPHHVGERGCAPGAPYRRARHRPGRGGADVRRHARRARLAGGARTPLARPAGTTRRGVVLPRHRLGPAARLHRRRCRALRDHAVPARRRLPRQATALADDGRAGRRSPR